MKHSKIREVDATPYAASLIEGHRDFGYSLETALADIVDNSVTAGASVVKLNADTLADKPWIALADDGTGMTERELVEAMRLGSKNPTDTRDAKDLGRFGLGLKSASFSQCRRLTVLTRRSGQTSCARWDLDRVAKRNDWSLELIDNSEIVTGYDLLSDNGTVVIWEKLDRLGGGYTQDRVKRIQHINAELSRAERHLRLVFHRFLEGAEPHLNLLINGRALKPLDPLGASYASGQWDPLEEIVLSRGTINIRCRTLPHHKMISKQEWEELGGPEGHLKSQGLYVYRENRLIISGGWLGLARQTELTKLCRIAIDIPNTMDSEWKIDVKKASAQLPPVVRERLKKVVERFVGTSKRTYRRRGHKLVDHTRFPIWSRLQKDSLIIFQPNLEHPVFRKYANQLPDGLREGFERCLRIVGAGLPIDALHAELFGNAESVTAAETSASDLEAVIHSLADTLVENGVSKTYLSETLQSIPFLKTKWDAAAPILEEFIRKHAL